MKQIPRIAITFESTGISQQVKYQKLSNGHISFEAVLQTVDEINRNTNKYPRDVLMEALNTLRIIDLVNRHAWCGEGSHPWDRKNFNRSVDILPSLLTHRICTMPALRGNELISTIHTIDPCGKTVVSWIVDEGMQLGFSMRGLTPYFYEVDSPVHHKVIKSPMNIITYDMVFFPSHENALMLTEDEVARTESAAFESAYDYEEICKEVTQESAFYDIFTSELGIELDPTKPITPVVGESAIWGHLKDGRMAKMELEQNILADIAHQLA